MVLNLMYITNNEKVAKIAENSGVNWIFIDLETVGKKSRQGHLNTVISGHNINDVIKIKKVLDKSKLLVRVNPIYKNSKEEIKRVINDGANIVMLPFFKSSIEVEKFMDYVDGQAETCLLLETPEAAEQLDSILKIKGIDYIHIGINDLSIGYRKKFMFELLADGTVEHLCCQINEKNIIYGFGGIAQLGEGLLPAEHIIAEHYRLKSSMAILSRSFCNQSNYRDLKIFKKIFKSGIKKIRDYEESLLFKKHDFFIENKKIIINKLLEITSQVN